jgi:2-polyprenyl-6-methoxyphenol hydroxylase-like FAD-dependent oxidoreductase
VLHRGRVLAEVDHAALAPASPFPFVLGVPQSTTEAVLTERLGTRGITVERGVELTACEQDADTVTARLRHPDGRIETLRSRWLAACDGSESRVRDALGIEVRGGSYPTSYALGDVDLAWDEPPDRAALLLGEHGVLGLHPIGPHRWRIALDRGPIRSKSRPSPPTHAQLQRMLDDHLLRPARVGEVHWSAYHRVRHRRAQQLRCGRVFLLGDAADVRSPLTFQGMNGGIQDAWNLGWKIACAERGIATEVLLDSYDAERRGFEGRITEDRGEIERMFALRSVLPRHARDVVFAFLASTPGFERSMARRSASPSFAYRDSPAVTGGAHDHPRPGDLAPEDPITTGGGVAIRDGRSYVSLLFMRTGDDIGAFRTPVWPTDGALRVRTVVVSREPRGRSTRGTALVDDPTGVLHRAWGPTRPTQVLVRPDGSIGWRGRPDDATALAEHLERLHGVQLRETAPAADRVELRAG